MRPDGRRPDELRPVRITPSPWGYAAGAALIEVGRTAVLCTASVSDQVPAWLAGQGKGWITAEYALLPASTHTRTPRERGGPRGRTQEIQRLIGRALRAAVDLEALGERLITVDADVLQADGGTRTAAITGGYVALALALRRLVEDGVLEALPLRRAVAAVSVGIVEGELRLDLCYEEDAVAEVDANLVFTDAGELVEVQATAEGMPFSRTQLEAMLDLAWKGARALLAVQRAVLEEG